MNENCPFDNTWKGTETLEAVSSQGAKNTGKGDNLHDMPKRIFLGKYFMSSAENFTKSAKH